MADDFDTESDIEHILRHARTVAVVGLSPKPHRDSYRIAQYMQARGWRVLPVNPAAASAGATILGMPVFATLAEAARQQTIDLVNVFRNSADVPPVAEDAIAIGAPALWLQSGIRHDGAAGLARKAGLRVVQDRCLMVEHRLRG